MEIGALKYLCDAIKLKVDNARFLICTDSLVMYKDIQAMQADLHHKTNLNWGSSTWFFHTLKVNFKWINREWNNIADNLAKEGFNRPKLIAGWI